MGSDMYCCIFSSENKINHHAFCFHLLNSFNGNHTFDFPTSKYNIKSLSVIMLPEKKTLGKMRSFGAHSFQRPLNFTTRNS